MSWRSRVGRSNSHSNWSLNMNLNIGFTTRSYSDSNSTSECPPHPHRGPKKRKSVTRSLFFRFPEKDLHGAMEDPVKCVSCRKAFTDTSQMPTPHTYIHTSVSIYIRTHHTLHILTVVDPYTHIQCLSLTFSCQTTFIPSSSEVIQ